MATFALIHGAGDVGWSWHLVEEELRRRGHDVVAPDLPCEDDTARLQDYAHAVVDAIGDRRELVVVGHSYGAFTAPLVADHLPVDALVVVAGMVPVAGERPADWWHDTQYRRAVEQQAQHDGGLTGGDDPFATYYHDVPCGLAERALARSRSESEAAYVDPWPLRRWPDVPTNAIVCSEDRFLPAPLARRVVVERLGVVPDEIAAGHCAPLSRPRALTDLLVGYLPRADVHCGPRDTSPRSKGARATSSRKAMTEPTMDDTNGGRVIWNTMVSLDGMVAGPGDDISWVFDVDSGDGTTAAELVAGAGALLVGRRTMDVEDRDRPGFYGGAYTGPFHVLTHDTGRDAPVVRGVTGTLVDGPIEDVVTSLREIAAGRDVLVLGGTVAAACWEAGLLDEVVLFVAPVVIGDGRSLWDGPVRRLDLVSVRREGDVTVMRLTPS